MILFILFIPLIEILLYIFLFHCDCLANFNLFAYGIYKEYWNEYLALLLIAILLYKRNKILDILIIILFSFIYLVDIIQLISYYYTDTFVTIDAFQNLDQILLFLNIKLIFALIFALSLLYIAIILIHKTNFKTRFRHLLILIIFIALNFSLYEFERNEYQGTLYDTCRIEKGPVFIFINTLKYYFKSKENIFVEKLSDQECDIGKKLNILDEKCQVIKNKKFYTRNLGIATIKKPNIIVIFVESLSAKYINYYYNKLIYSTPNIDNFAKKSLVFKNYINSGFPTLYGLYSQLCSTYPAGISNSNAKVFLKTFKYNLPNQCLPLYFNQYNYDTVYFNHGGENRKNMKEIIKYIGFKKIFFNRQLKEIFKEDAVHKIDYDYDDKQMMQFLVKFLEERKSNNKPFFISLSTIGTHVGLEPVIDNKNLKNLSMPQVQYKALDNAMKVFFDYFFKSKYTKNTIVILTGDHTRPGYSKKYNATTFDDLALMIYTPWTKHRELIANASSVALAPTILQMINYPNKTNTFLGKSLFENNNNNIAIGVTSRSSICYNFKINTKCKDTPEETLKKITKYIFLRSNK